LAGMWECLPHGTMRNGTGLTNIFLCDGSRNWTKNFLTQVFCTHSKNFHTLLVGFIEKEERMEYTTNDGRVLGLVLDLSLRQGPDGKRIVDTVKKQLINFLRETMDGEDLFYLYHPEIVDATLTIGSMVGEVGNYETNGYQFDLNHALLQTYLVVTAEDEDYERAIILITDRCRQHVPITKMLGLDKRDQAGCSYILVGIGSHYFPETLQPKHPAVSYCHIDDPKDLKDVLLNRRNS